MSKQFLPSVGLVGVGTIGALMGVNLLRAGYSVIAWDRRPEALDAIVGAGGRAAGNLREVGSADIVLSIVFDDKGVEEVAFGAEGLVATMSAGACHVILSTISPGLARKLSERHALRGQKFLATSMFGRPEAAAAGQTMFTCSGPSETYEMVAPVLSVLGTSRWVGPDPEQAMMIKIIGNSMIHAAVELLREMFDFLSAGGVSMREAKESVVDRLFPGLIFEGYAERLIEDPGRPKATHPMQIKDSSLCVETAKKLGVELPMIEFLHNVGRSL